MRPYMSKADRDVRALILRSRERIEKMGINIGPAPKLKGGGVYDVDGDQSEQVRVDADGEPIPFGYELDYDNEIMGNEKSSPDIVLVQNTNTDPYRGAMVKARELPSGAKEMMKLMDTVSQFGEYPFNADGVAKQKEKKEIAMLEKCLEGSIQDLVNFVETWQDVFYRIQTIGNPDIASTSWIAHPVKFGYSSRFISPIARYVEFYVATDNDGSRLGIDFCVERGLFNKKHRWISIIEPSNIMSTEERVNHIFKSIVDEDDGFAPKSLWRYRKFSYKDRLDFCRDLIQQAITRLHDYLSEARTKLEDAVKLYLPQ